MSARDDVLHDLNDRLNGIMISVELSMRLLEQNEAKEVAHILARLRDDCLACNELVHSLRQSRGGSAKDSRR